MKKFLSLLMATFMSLAMLTGCGNGTTSGSNTTEEVVEKAPSSEYVAVLNEFGLEDVNYTFKGKKSIVFASKVSDETLEILAFGYTNDIAEEMYDKVYLDITDYDDNMIDQVDKNIRDQFDMVNDLDFASIEYTVDKDINKYIIEIHYSDLSRANVEKMVSEGLISGTAGMNQISIEQTAQAAAENGLVER